VRILSTEPVVIMPIGSAAANHGPHLDLRTDHSVIDYLRRQLVGRVSSLALPTMPFDLAPATWDYQGAASVSVAAQRDVIVDLCRTLVREGVRRFYVLALNGAASPAIEAASRVMAGDGILVKGSDLSLAADTGLKMSADEVHGNDAETSIVLAMDATAADMSRAWPEFRSMPAGERFSHIWLDARHASADRGSRILRVMVERLTRELEALRTAYLPKGGSDPRPEPPAGAVAALSGTLDRITGRRARHSLPCNRVSGGLVPARRVGSRGTVDDRRRHAAPGRRGRARAPINRPEPCGDLQAPGISSEPAPAHSHDGAVPGT
jgi:creatinine amidohydrolase